VLGEAGKHDVRPLLDKNEPAPPSDSGLTPPQPKHDPGAPPASGSKVYVYEVQKGDTLERIARALYGDGQRWREIAAANPTIGDGQKIRAGDHLTLNAAPTHESSAVVAKEPGAALPAPKPETPNAAVATAFKRTTAQEQYQVQKGDTLMSIAAANYGTKAAWRLILDANADKIPDKDRIKTGIVLKLPTN
jgi:nucleoid-associated protein YgaU